MGAALRQRQDMVDFFGRGDFTGPLALLAQWVGCDIAVTNPLPCAAIPALAGRIALVLVVMRRDDFLVFLAIAPGVQARAAGIGTGALGFVWHTDCRLLPAKRKPPQLFLRRPLYFFFVAIIILPDFHSVFLCLLVSSFSLPVPDIDAILIADYLRK